MYSSGRAAVADRVGWLRRVGLSGGGGQGTTHVVPGYSPESTNTPFYRGCAKRCVRCGEQGAPCRIMAGVSSSSSLRALREHRQRRSAVGSTHRSGIGTERIGCRGFAGPVPPPLLISALSGREGGTPLRSCQSYPPPGTNGVRALGHGSIILPDWGKGRGKGRLRSVTRPPCRHVGSRPLARPLSATSLQDPTATVSVSAGTKGMTAVFIIIGIGFGAWLLDGGGGFLFGGLTGFLVAEVVKLRRPGPRSRTPGPRSGAVSGDSGEQAPVWTSRRCLPRLPRSGRRHLLRPRPCPMSCRPRSSPNRSPRWNPGRSKVLLRRAPGRRTPCGYPSPIKALRSV